MYLCIFKKGKKMRVLMVNNLNGVYITVAMASELCNLGVNTVRKRAMECGAMKKIGKSVRINREVFLSYIDSFEA